MTYSSLQLQSHENAVIILSSAIVLTRQEPTNVGLLRNLCLKQIIY